MNKCNSTFDMKLWFKLYLRILLRSAYENSNVPWKFGYTFRQFLFKTLLWPHTVCRIVSSQLFQLNKLPNAGIFEIVSSTQDNNVQIPYVTISKGAFKLRSWLMKPFPYKDLPRNRRVFNYRLSQARITVESAFGN